LRNVTGSENLVSYVPLGATMRSSSQRLLIALVLAGGPALARAQAPLPLPAPVPGVPPAAALPVESGGGPVGPWVVRVGWGVGSVLQVAEGLGRGLQSAFSAGMTSLGPSRVVGPMVVTAERDFGETYTVGLSYSYLRIRRDVFDRGSIAGTQEDAFHTAMAEGLGRYLQRGTFHLYTGLSAGATFLRTSDASSPGNGNSVHPFYHLHLLGMRWGSRVGVWADLGVGALGVVNGGLLVRF
jgi:hypothetical protein